MCRTQRVRGSVAERTAGQWRVATRRVIAPTMPRPAKGGRTWSGWPAPARRLLQAASRGDHLRHRRGGDVTDECEVHSRRRRSVAQRRAALGDRRPGIRGGCSVRCGCLDGGQPGWSGDVPHRLARGVGRTSRLAQDAARLADHDRWGKRWRAVLVRPAGKVANLRGVGGNALRRERAADPAPRPEPRAVEVRELVDKPWPPHRRTQRLAPASIGSRFDGGPGKL